MNPNIKGCVLPTTVESIEATKRLVCEGELDAGTVFLSTPSKVLAEICNGCGSASAKFDFVPDSIYGVSVKSCCHIHDFDYHMGREIGDKEAADRRLLNNQLRVINRVTGWRKYIKPLMRRRALKYYEAVNAFGGPAFWACKAEIGKVCS